MSIEYLKKHSFTDFLEENSGKTGIEFYAQLYEEDPSNFIELSKKINTLLEGFIIIESVVIKDKSCQIKTNKGNRELEYDFPSLLGLIGNVEGNQLLYFGLLNDILSENGFSERVIIYYDELIPDIHWIGLIKKGTSHALMEFITKTDPEDCKDFVSVMNGGPRVLGIGISDEDILKYSELIIFP